MNEEVWLSGLGGAIITIVLSKINEWIRFRNSRKTLYQAIFAECQYNLGIVNEMLDGMLKGATFKRMSVEFFKEMRLQAVQYALDKDLLRKLSNLIVDLELYNREADFVFDRHLDSVVYTGFSGNEEICIAKKSVPHDLAKVVTAACKGVSNSLNGVIESVTKETR